MRQIFDAYLGTKGVICFTLMGKLLPKPNNPGSGGGWHHGSFFHEVKSFLYLSDVDENCGPFQFIPKSNKLGNVLRHIWKARLGFRQNRMSDAEVERILTGTNKKIITVCRPAGTLILCNTAMIHRGKPGPTGTRYAFTNYVMERYNYTAGRMARHPVPFRPEEALPKNASACAGP